MPKRGAESVSTVTNEAAVFLNAREVPAMQINLPGEAEEKELLPGFLKEIVAHGYTILLDPGALKIANNVIYSAGIEQKVKSIRMAFWPNKMLREPKEEATVTLLFTKENINPEKTSGFFIFAPYKPNYECFNFRIRRT